MLAQTLSPGASCPLLPFCCSSRSTATMQPSLPKRQQRRRQGRRAAPPPSAGLVLADVAEAAAAAVAAGGEVQPWILPAAGAGVLLAGVAGLRLYTYSQLEYITAAMLARHVKPGGARVLQVGGTTRDVFYYPAGTLQVTVGGADLNLGLWEQAGMQAKVPVSAVKAEPQKFLSSQAGAAADSIVLINSLHLWPDMQQLLAQVYRVLKPGGTFVFIQRLRGGALQGLLGGGSGLEPAAVDAVQQYSGWDFVQWDTALAGSDPHCVGVAIKPLSANAPAPAASVDNDAFEQLMRRGKGKQQQRQAQRGGGFRKSQ